MVPEDCVALWKAPRAHRLPLDGQNGYRDTPG
jgi:hypothetical protein